MTAALSVSPLADMSALDEDHSSSVASSNVANDDSEADQKDHYRSDIDLRQEIQSLFFLLFWRCWSDAQIHEVLLRPDHSQLTQSVAGLGHGAP